MAWILSLVATSLSLIAMWLYGNKSWKAPIIALIMYSIWAFYDIHYDQLPLLIPTFLNAIIAVRNLAKMKHEKGL